MDRVKLYNEVKNKLEELADKQGVYIEKYYHPNCSCWHDKRPNYFEELCGDIQDGSYISGVIGYWKEYSKENNKSILVKDKISGIFNGFQYQNALDYDNWTLLINHFCDVMPNTVNKEKHWINNGNSETKANTMWQQYVKGLYNGAEYLSEHKSFENTMKLKEFLNAAPKTIEEVKELLYQLRSLWSKVSGMGIPLCYNWIKECGATWLAKPDTHISRVVDSIIEKDYSTWDKFIIHNPAYEKYNNKPRKPCVYSEERIALFMWEWAKEIRESNKHGDKECTTYKLDRILYLYCTNGFFYLDKDKIISEENLLSIINQN